MTNHPNILYTPHDSNVIDTINNQRVRKTKTKTLKDYPETQQLVFRMISDFVDAGKKVYDFDEFHDFDRLFGSDAEPDDIFKIEQPEPYTQSDFEATLVYRVEKNDYIRAKHVLVDLGYIRVSRETTNTKDVNGRTVFRSSPSRYTATPKFLNLIFTPVKHEPSNSAVDLLDPILSNGKVMTQLHSIADSSPLPNLSFSSLSLNLTCIQLPTHRTIDELRLCRYSTTKLLNDDSEIFGICLWILTCVQTCNLHISDSSITELTKVKLKKVKKAKKALHDLGYITSKVITINKHKGSLYGTGTKWHNLEFTKSITSIDIAVEPQKERKQSKSKKKVTRRTETFTRPLCGDTVTKRGNEYLIDVYAHIHLPSDDHVIELLEAQCGDRPLKVNTDRLRAALAVIDLIRGDFYNEFNNGNVVEACEFEIGEHTWVLLEPNKYRNVSQYRFRKETGNEHGTSYNTEGLSSAKETLKELGWIEVKPSGKGVNEESDIRGEGESYRSPNLKDPETKAYRLTEEFYDNHIDSRSSSLSIPVSKKVSTPYRGLAMAELDPQVFDIFDRVADERNWDKPTRSHQYSQLKNFDYLRGYSDKKSYRTVNNSRIYTTISKLPREFRPYIRIDGERTVEVDIKSAHSVFLTLEMDDQDQIDQWMDIINGNYNTNTKGKRDIYYYFIDTLGIHTDSLEKYPTREDQRDQCKLVLNAYYNGASNQENMDKKLKFNTPLQDFMMVEFPNVHSTIKRLLENYRCSGLDGSALRLQEIESDIMGTYFMEQSKYTCISIHDGLLVKESEAQMFIDAITKHAKRKYGLSILVDTK